MLRSFSCSLYLFIIFFPHFTFSNTIYGVPCAPSHVIAFLILFGSYLWVPNCIKQKTYSNAYLVGLSFSIFPFFFLHFVSFRFLSHPSVLPFYYLLSPPQFHFILFRSAFSFHVYIDIYVCVFTFLSPSSFHSLLLFIRLSFSNSTYETLQNQQYDRLCIWWKKKCLKIVMLHTHIHNRTHGYSKTHCVLASSSSRKTTKQ